MKIALCKSHFAGPVSGADETLVTYAIALHEAGEDVRVVLFYKYSEDDEYFMRLKRSGVEVTCVITNSATFMILRRLRDLLGSMFFLFLIVPQAPERFRRIWQVVLNQISRLHYRESRAFFAATRPDLLHVVTPDTGAEMMIRAGHELGIPVLYQELGTPQYLPMLEMYYRRLEKVLPLCSEVAALSPDLAAQWSAKFTSLKPLTVMPLMVGDCDRSPTRENRTVVFKNRSERKGEIVFGYAARLEEGKGPGVLVKALSRLHLDQPPMILRMAGLGPMLSQLKALTRQLGLNDACEFVGHYSEPLGRSSFMRSIDVFILPSLAEGTPNSIIEAMAHGLPIIATSVGGIPELLSNDCGILVEPGDHEGLAQAMKGLASDPELRERMGRAARERYFSLFSPEAVLPVLKSTYLRVASSRRIAGAISAEGVEHPWEVVPEF